MSVVNRIKDKMKRKGIYGKKVVSINEIKKFENKIGITLPEEIVLFYTQICNGCKMLDDFELLSMEEWKYDIENVKKSFLFTKYWIWEDDYDEDRIKHISDGNVELIDIGDAQSWNIIVKGSEKGKMWFFTDVGIQPCVPSMNFFEWFEFWLDGNENYFENKIFDFYFHFEPK